MTPTLAKPSPIMWAARCHVCGWVSPAHTSPDRLTNTCPLCGEKEDRP
jgi:rubrerythrin